MLYQLLVTSSLQVVDWKALKTEKKLTLEQELKHWSFVSEKSASISRL